MTANKKVKIRGQEYRMYQTKTGWVFVEGRRAQRTYAIAKIVDGKAVETEPQEALRYATNQELIEAWLEQ